MNDQDAADYWNKHLEHNRLRMNNTTSAGASAAYFLEAAGDILREATKPAYCAPDYINEKVKRLKTATKFKRDWSDRLSPSEAESLKGIQELVKHIPVTSGKVGTIKTLIVHVADRDVYSVIAAIDRLPSPERLCHPARPAHPAR